MYELDQVLKALHDALAAAPEAERNALEAALERLGETEVRVLTQPSESLALAFLDTTIEALDASGVRGIISEGRDR